MCLQKVDEECVSCYAITSMSLNFLICKMVTAKRGRGSGTCCLAQIVALSFSSCLTPAGHLPGLL